MKGDPLSLAIKIIAATIQALVCGSLFYDLPKTSESIFLRPGALFFPVFYFLMEAMSETTASFMGRPILARQKRFGFYRPTAFCIANAIIDIPVVMMQVTVFSLILYFMTHLQVDAAKFFTFWIVVNVNCLTFLQLFRYGGCAVRDLWYGIAADGSAVYRLLCLWGLPDPLREHAPLVPLDLLPQPGRVRVRVAYGE
jgi:hypothetical protein